MIIEQTAIIEAPLEFVMQVMEDVESIPTWATVDGKIENIRGSGPGMSYDWHFTVDGLEFKGQSQVIEQTADTLITETTGDVVSIWTINLTPVGQNSTAMRVVVEYTPLYAFVEVLTDIVLQRYATPKEARENMRRFKEMVEERVHVTKYSIV